jgi:hypothetical protein
MTDLLSFLKQQCATTLKFGIIDAADGCQYRSCVISSMAKNGLPPRALGMSIDAMKKAKGHGVTHLAPFDLRHCLLPAG